MEISNFTEGQKFNEDRFTKIDMIKQRNSVCFMLNFLPGQHMKPHAHPNKELYLFVVEGTGTLICDDQEMEVKRGDVIFCHAEEEIGFTNTSDKNVSIYATMSKVADRAT